MTTSAQLSLVLKNDDSNSFIGVIQSLMIVMKYEQIQAEQLATLAHHKGEITLRQGSYVELENLKFELESMNLNVEVR